MQNHLAALHTDYNILNLTILSKIPMSTESKANFIKRVQKRSKSHYFKAPSVQSTIPKAIYNLSMVPFSIKRQDIKHFQVIGIVDKKVIITYNNQLKLFGYFDLHAVHQRIRYEFYCWKIKAEEWTTSQLGKFDNQAIEKGDKMPHNAYGPLKKCLVKVSNSKGCDFKSNTTVWGMRFDSNNSNECFITSIKPIYGKQFSQTEIERIAQQIMFLDKGRIPTLIDEWIGEFSCKSAYKFNDDLQIEYAKLLITNLGNCVFPWHCVHGRTTIHVKPWPTHK